MRALTLYLVLLNTIFSQQDRTTMGVSLQTQNGLDNNFSINPEQMDLINQGYMHPLGLIILNSNSIIIAIPIVYPYPVFAIYYTSGYTKIIT